MKVWILILAVSSLVVTVATQVCPPTHFSAVIVGSVDETVEGLDFISEDLELLFFRKGLHFDEEEIHHVFEDAMDFFNNTFGLDFSVSPPNEYNIRYLENAIMYPFILRKEINYIATANNWIRNGNTRSRCYRIYDGGISVAFLNYTTLYGRYGGEEGKPAVPFEPLLYGFYSIDVCEQSPVLIHYRCPTPIRAEPIDGTYVLNCYAFNRILGRGKTQGIGIIRPDQDDPGKYIFNFKNIITFRSGGEKNGPGEKKGPDRDGPEREGPQEEAFYHG